MTKIIGLTGGIGSGKTSIAKHIQSLGIPVYISDDASKKILSLPQTLQAIMRIFGTAVFENEKLSREKLAKTVFDNPENLEKLNQIIHPAVKLDFQSWLTQHKQAALVVKEAAILFESGTYKDCDAIITVVAPEAIRIQRVMERDKTDIQSVLNRINNQWTDAMRIAKSDYVIENTDFDKAVAKTDEILKKLMNQQK